MAAFGPAVVALDGGDPRLSVDPGEPPSYTTAAGRDLGRLAHDPSVTIEEYFYWAKLSRKEEEAMIAPSHPWGEALGLKKSKQVSANTSAEDVATDEKNPKVESPGSSVQQSPIGDGEWHQAQRAARTAGWSAMFYLITTDILGPFSVPWALSQMGYGEGITLYTVFGVLAFVAGFYIYQMFLALDSTKYPMKNFGDIAYRTMGPWARHGSNFLQSLQLLFNVGVIIIGNAQGLWQINSNICYIVCAVIWAVCGMLVGQIRTLHRFQWIANFAVWLNVTVMIMTMAVVASSAPDYEAANGQSNVPIDPPAPVHTSGTRPDGSALTDQIVGLMQAVYSYGGAMLYCEFMSEMRRPMDFWKAIVCAECFIYGCYLFFGVFVYSYQGQYTINPANQGMSLRGAQVAGNILSLLSALLAAALYGNIGIKVIYQNCLKEWFGFPDITSKTGKYLWVGIVPIYWALAFILAAAIPNFSALSGLVAALCIMQFTYTFPPILKVAMDVQRDAMRDGEGFDPATGQTIRHDNGWRRWVRGFFAKRWYINILNVIFFLGALVTMVLGVYSAIVSMIDSYKHSKATAFGCHPLL
ncbi:oligopeptide transporter protein [Polychaeton citri CBS 116435]|uniref:Oligopeptide transporter protein n=1 Tax=Polychaeton citri CBS 116435 TaxID=1314669 RepID=A0A9P4Q0I5_9PEZI|nr:oligopeptide transporter protein [Polychaeton citri CBS 116435]